MTLTEEAIRLLCYIGKRRFVSPNSIAREFKVTPTRLYLLLARLEAEGYLKHETYEQGSSCNKCPLRFICRGSCPTGTGVINIYMLTEKGREFLDRRICSKYIK